MWGGASALPPSFRSALLATNHAQVSLRLATLTGSAGDLVVGLVVSYLEFSWLFATGALGIGPFCVKMPAELMMIDLEEKIVATGTWLYDRTVPRAIEVHARPARLASRFIEAEENDAIPDTPSGFVLDRSTPIPDMPTAARYLLSAVPRNL